MFGVEFGDVDLGLDMAMRRDMTSAKICNQWCSTREIRQEQQRIQPESKQVDVEFLSLVECYITEYE